MQHRPDPDHLLAMVQQQESGRGALKIFFGASAGVGKTYAMLQAAHDQQDAGVEVVVGYVETHGRAETDALLEGLERLPTRSADYRGTSLREFDLDGALARKPYLLLVDELAHTNASGSRHLKRWQDVEELLAAGINVYTTVNVQHLESLNDVVAQITGVVVRETVPDSIIESADEIELIDLPPGELLQRLREGKVYVPQQAERAAQGFFRKGNLHALRELALRRTADRVDAQMQHYKRDHAIRDTWPTHERLLVCVGPGPLAIRLVRAARRMAAHLRAEWIVLYVELPSHARLPEDDRERLIQTLRLAEQLGAQTLTVSGTSVSAEVLGYARLRNVTRIVVGKPRQPRWREAIAGSVVDSIVRHSEAIDVHVLTGEVSDSDIAPSARIERTSSGGAYGWSLLSVGVCTLVAYGVTWLLPEIAETNLVMIYLLGVLLVATRVGRGPSILASLLSVAAFDFFFVPPQGTFAVSDVQYIATFGVMLLVALLLSTLTTRLQQQAANARRREQRTAALYAMSRELASRRAVDGLLRAAVRNTSEVFESQVCVLLPTASGKLQPWGSFAGWWGSEISESMVFAPGSDEQGVARWVFDHHERAGHGTNTLPGAAALYVPLLASHGMIGVLGVRPKSHGTLHNPEQIHLLETFASQIALALERARLAEEAQQAQIQVQTEQLRNSLLSSVSHDLRTPLAAIAGAASSLLDNEATLPASTRRELTQSIDDEADRLSRLVSNLLDMTRLESGALQVHKEWQPLEEVVGAALARMERHLHGRQIDIALPPDGPLVPLDSVLIEQVLINLLDNAAHYTPPGTPISISAWSEGGNALVEVADRGPGVAPGSEADLFEKFHRGGTSNRRGAGLGLTIARGIITAHGGRIWAAPRPGGGLAIRFALPLGGPPPVVQLEEPA